MLRAYSVKRATGMTEMHRGGCRELQNLFQFFSERAAEAEDEEGSGMIVLIQRF